MKAQFTVLEKIPAVLWGFVMRCGNSAAETGFDHGSRGNVRKCRGQRSTQDGRWPKMPSTRLITTKLHPVLARKTETYNIYSRLRDRVIFTDFVTSLDGTLRWRVELCSVVGGSDRAESSNSALLNHVRCWSC